MRSCAGSVGCAVGEPLAASHVGRERNRRTRIARIGMPPRRSAPEQRRSRSRARDEPSHIHDLAALDDRERSRIFSRNSNRCVRERRFVRRRRPLWRQTRFARKATARASPRARGASATLAFLSLNRSERVCLRVCLASPRLPPASASASARVRIGVGRIGVGLPRPHRRRPPASASASASESTSASASESTSASAPALGDPSISSRAA